MTSNITQPWQCYNRWENIVLLYEQLNPNIKRT